MCPQTPTVSIPICFLIFHPEEREFQLSIYSHTLSENFSQLPRQAKAIHILKPCKDRTSQFIVDLSVFLFVSVKVWNT
jgi:hypothetical protein